MKFYDKMLETALNIANDARNEQSLNMKACNNNGQSNLKSITSRLEVTTNLSFLVSWLYFQKAVENGEFSQEDFLQKCPSLCDSCIDKNCQIKSNPNLSPSLNKIKKASDQLYCRIARIDKTIRSQE